MTDDLNCDDSVFLTKSFNRKYFTHECNWGKKRRLYLLKDKGSRKGVGEKRLEKEEISSILLQ